MRSQLSNQNKQFVATIQCNIQKIIVETTNDHRDTNLATQNISTKTNIILGLMRSQSENEIFLQLQ